MKLKAALIFSAVPALMVLPAHAAAPRSVDARTFDVAGVKTGMDMEEAIAAIANNFQVSKKDIRIGYASDDPVLKTKTPHTVSYAKDGVELMVHFEPRVPLDPKRPLVAAQISYEMPWTPANKQAMADAVVQKYGKQSNFPNDLNLEWCVNPSTNPGMGCGNDMKQATLKYSGVSIKLVDPAWINARIAYVDQSKARKPSF